MDDVKWFKVDLPGQFDRKHEQISADVVLKFDFDVQRLRADTAEAERDVLQQELFKRAGDIGRLTGERDADEHRIAELKADNQQLRKLLEQTLSALNPTAKLSKSIRAALNPKPEAGSHES